MDAVLLIILELLTSLWHVLIGTVVFATSLIAYALIFTFFSSWNYLVKYLFSKHKKKGAERQGFRFIPFG